MVMKPGKVLCFMSFCYFGGVDPAQSLAKYKRWLICVLRQLTNRCSGKASAPLPEATYQGGRQTGHKRAEKIEPNPEEAKIPLQRDAQITTGCLYICILLTYFWFLHIIIPQNGSS